MHSKTAFAAILLCASLSAALGPSARAQKDVVIDSAPASAASAASALAQAAAPDRLLAASLGELGLDLLRQQGPTSGSTSVNAVLSPLGLSTALGMLHAGSSGATGRELAGLLDSAPAGSRNLAVRLPAALKRLGAAEAGTLATANRVWIASSVASAVPAAYTTRVADRYGADATLLSFRDANAARNTVNQWVSGKTAQRIPELMPPGSIKPTSRLIVTNAMFFKSPWAQPFDAAKTVAKPFRTGSGASKPVPTMLGEHGARSGVIDGLTIYELPFAGGQFSLTIAMPPAGQTLDAMEHELSGADMAEWSQQLAPVSCQLELPKFRIAPVSRSLKPVLQVMGVTTAFGDEADFGPMLGRAAANVHLADVFHAGGITIDEQGGEAVSATGAAVQLKSFSPPMACAVDRAFLFVVTHRATGLPLFIGRVVDPSAV